MTILFQFLPILLLTSHQLFVPCGPKRSLLKRAVRSGIAEGLGRPSQFDQTGDEGVATVGGNAAV
jgi:hypothetical protein